MCTGAHMCAFFLGVLNCRMTWLRGAQGLSAWAKQSSSSFSVPEFSDYRTQVVASGVALNSHTEHVNSNITTHNHHVVTQLVLNDLVTLALIRFWFGNFIWYGEIISFNMGILRPGSSHSTQCISFTQPSSSHSSVQNHRWLLRSSSNSLRLGPQECPLRLSANPRYSGFSAVGVTNPFICLGMTPSVSSPSGSFTPEAPAPVLALARWSR